MSAYLLNQEDSIPVVRKNHKAVVVPSNLENESVARKHFGEGEVVFDILRASPLSIFGDQKPRCERCSGIRMLADELLDLVYREDLHVVHELYLQIFMGEKEKFPKRELYSSSLRHLLNFLLAALRGKSIAVNELAILVCSEDG